MADTQAKKKDRDDILEMSDEDIIALVNSDFTVSERWRDGSGVNDRNRRYRKAYFQQEYTTQVSKKDKPQEESSKRARNWIPIIRAIVDTARSMIAESIFSQDPFVYVEPNEKGDEEHSASYQDLFRFRAGQSQMNLKTKFKDQFLFQACLYDFVIGRVGWLTKKGYVPHRKENALTQLYHYVFPRDKIDIQMIPKPDAIDRPDFEVLNTLLCYPDPQATDFDDSRFFIYEDITNTSELRKMAKGKDNPFGIYDNIDKIEPNSFPGLKAEQDGLDKDKHQKEHEAGLVLRKNYYTPNAMVQIANNKWVIRKKRIYGYPFTKGTWCQPDHQWSGVGLAEGLESLQLDINQLIRIRRNNINYIVNAVRIVNRALFGLGHNQELRDYPGRTHYISQGDPTKAIHYARPPDTTQTILQDVNFNLQMAERVSGVSENAMGMWRIGGRRTAQEAGIVAAGTETRIGEVASRFEEKNITDIVNMDYNLELQFLTKPQKYRILGKKGFEFKTAGKLDILHKGSFDIRPIGTKFFGNKQFKDNQFLQMMNAVGANPAFMQISDAQAILKEGWHRVGEKDPERFLRDMSTTDYKIPPEIENQMMARGEILDPGNYDDDMEHINSHSNFLESGDCPGEYTHLVEEHGTKHQQRYEALQKGGKGVQLPQSEENILGQPSQMYGGQRVPGGGEGVGPMAPAEGGMSPPGLAQ